MPGSGRLIGSSVPGAVMTPMNWDSVPLIVTGHLNVDAVICCVPLFSATRCQLPPNVHSHDFTLPVDFVIAHVKSIACRSPKSPLQNVSPHTRSKPSLSA